MADLAAENIVGEAVVAQLRDITSALVVLNKRNCYLVPDLMEPPGSFSGAMVQVKYPTIAPYGAGGGLYMQRVTLLTALYVRYAADPHSEWDGILTRVGEIALACRKQIHDFSAGGLSIHLYDTDQVMSVRPLEVVGPTGQKTGQIAKDVLWTAWQSWGVMGGHYEDMLIPESP